MVDLINKFEFNNLILTDTGVFSVRFHKDMTYEKYWSNLIKQLSEHGLYVSDVIYTVEFGMLLIKKEKQENVSVEKLDNSNLSKTWRSYIDKLNLRQQN